MANSWASHMEFGRISSYSPEAVAAAAMARDGIFLLIDFDGIQRCYHIHHLFEGIALTNRLLQQNKTSEKHTFNSFLPRSSFEVV